MDISGNIAELTEFFRDEKDDDETEDEESPRNGGVQRARVLDVGGGNFRRSTADSGISFNYMDSMDDETVFQRPPPPKGEPIHCSSPRAR